MGQDVVICEYHGSHEPYRGKVVNLYQIEGLNRVACDEAKVGDIVTLSGIENITIGDTLCDPNAVEPLPFVKISEPTVEMTFSVNNSPFACLLYTSGQFQDCPVFSYAIQTAVGSGERRRRESFLSGLQRYREWEW